MRRLHQPAREQAMRIARSGSRRRHGAKMSPSCQGTDEMSRPCLDGIADSTGCGSVRVWAMSRHGSDASTAVCC
jgi:hypothetical protein